MIGWISTGCAVLMGVLLCLTLLQATQRGRLWWSLSMGPLVGLSLSSCLLYLMMMVADGQPLWVLLVDGLVSVGVSIGVVMRWGGRVSNGISESLAGVKNASSISLIALVCLLVTMGMIGAECRNHHRVRPDGWWDAVMIWNVRAKFFVRGTFGLAHDFQVDPMGHGDYPLMLQLSVSRMWGIEGIEHPSDPLLIQGILLVSLVMLIVVFVTERSGLMWGATAGLVMLSWPAYGEQLSWQIADIPLSAFLLGTCVALTKAASQREKEAFLWWLLMSGFLAASSAWMKNEGLVTMGIAALIAGFISWRRGMMATGVITFTKGAGPVLLVLGLFKLLYAPTSDLLATRTVSITELITDPTRHEMIWWFFGFLIWQTACWPVCLLVALVVVGVVMGWRISVGGTVIALVFVAALSGSYYLAYLTTPHDLDWHLGTSIHRLALQVWPLVVLGAVGFDSRQKTTVN
ncbi:hypothetical protein [Lacunimicrobium album]